ncbi:MAG: hypothetical protein IPP29_14800 [Bacteroidetes bacterium]|nr:hypothetical protein [Bacteroidota bacterium]
MNEENAYVSDNRYYCGILYSDANPANDLLPDGNWQAIDVWQGTNDWGGIKPIVQIQTCNNINSALITPNNYLITGKQGNIFITRTQLPPRGDIDWQQIYTEERSALCNSSETEYSHIGYVNTATQNVFPVNKSEVWISDRDRPLNYSSNQGVHAQRINSISECLIQNLEVMLFATKQAQ